MERSETVSVPLVQREVLLDESLQFSRVVVQYRLMDGSQDGSELVVILCESLDTKHKAQYLRPQGFSTRFRGMFRGVATPAILGNA